jgi:AcrR family transcriptional regulator
LTPEAALPYTSAMAREKDAEKRTAILAEAKRLFAERGFHATSIADIVRDIDMPVGSVYTYFKTKDDIIRTIIEEGWAGFRDSLVQAMATETDGKKKLAIIVNHFLPELFSDVDFISILLTEASSLGSVGEKLVFLSELIGGVLRESGIGAKGLVLDDRDAIAGLMVFFLGSLDSIRLTRAASLPVTEADIINFIRHVIANAYGVDMDALAP